MTTKIAVVTGSNKGIGYAIIKGLCEKYPGKVYLTSRDESKGQAAVASLKALGLDPSFHPLDIDNQDSVDKFRNYIKQNYGTIDILINNAGIAFKLTAKESYSEQAETTVNINYFGTLRVSEALIPLLGQDARVINISSSTGHLSRLPSDELKKKFSDSNLTIPALNNIMSEFITAAKEDPNASSKWGKLTYGVSKIGVSALTRIYQRMLDNEIPFRNICVNCVHPGYVVTDMTSRTGFLTIEEGAVAPLYLALEPHGLKGQYVWSDCSVVDWLAPKTPTLY